MSPKLASKPNDAEDVLNSADLIEQNPIVHAVTCDGALFRGQCVAKGDTVIFGKYPQKEHYLEGKLPLERIYPPEPLEWIVFDIKSNGANNRILLLSKYVIDSYQYDSSHEVVSTHNFHAKVYTMKAWIYPTWAESDIRKWLNETSASGFLNPSFFATEDQSLIVEVTHSTSDYENYDGGADTQDKVFLLDRIEVENSALWPDCSARIAQATKYALSTGVRSKGNGSGLFGICKNIECDVGYWLRSPFDRPGTAAS
ncbi:MAG: hypothetical protein IJ268_12345 [Proteobacteria bacterium]|nr:hypothetical protein [Pseudomonadota bacterium]